VVLEVAGSKEALVVPAFTAGRETISRAIEFYVSRGVDRSALSVLLDNAQAIEWHVNRTGVMAEWSVLQIDRVPLASITAGKRIGTMKPEPFLQLVNAILSFAQTTPGQGQFSAPLLKKLRKLAEELQGT
jgi:hypothetical protein